MASRAVHFEKLEPRSAVFDGVLIVAAGIVAIGMGAVWYMEHFGHIVTGMNNQIVWGLPHVFAILLVVAASGALNVASMSSVFGKKEYKPYARLSGLLALALLAGGLAVLVLDLGRPERLMLAMTTYNFKSIFAWNIYLYTGFMGVVIVYLFTMMARKTERFVKPAGYLAFVVRLILTTGTGSIFGFLVARETYDAALFAPLFIASSFVYGLAFTVLVLRFAGREVEGGLLPQAMIDRFRGLFYIFIAAVFYFTTTYFLTNLYATEHHGAVQFILTSGNVYSLIFWIGQILVGTMLPVAVLLMPGFGKSKNALTLASVLFILGGIAQLYVIVIGGQAYPLDLFPGMIESSSFNDGVVGTYTPSLPEIALGVTGIAIMLLIAGVVMRLMPFLPKLNSA